MPAADDDETYRARIAETPGVSIRAELAAFFTRMGLGGRGTDL